MPRDIRLDAEASTFLTKVTSLGIATALPVVLSGAELARLIGVIYRDTDRAQLLPAELQATIVPDQDYYATPLAWFEAQYDVQGTGQIDHIDLMLRGRGEIPDFNTYLHCLSSLHKRRKKYARILSAQPIPTMVQVSPRALVEYGGIEPDALASWLTWRKWFYDLDNRSAQETGYLFEPILAAALGGEPKGARAKAVTRAGDGTKGRQVDCWKILPNGDKLAYEFKLRVTIAASGQGRFGEELDFARDCRASGAKPILLVLDPTPNPRLADLQAAFRAHGGEAYVGDDAWHHLEFEAGPTMATFIDRYVSAPIHMVSNFGGQLLDLTARRLDNGHIQLAVGAHQRLILRREDFALSDESEADDDA
ncbi:ApaLI family restriction endonuclease [Paraburkholderia terrae]|uniref:ApaLI family restriction endonuclease n=1 Tax=Paraburkholderia terrae TaxID=311230 RepID=A0A2I8EF67_9BURK|nr:ApaLI family restriction endonuclease [Paraburkholderia terrae]